MEDVSIDFSPYYSLIRNKLDKMTEVEIPSTDTIVEKKPLEKFKINEKKKTVDEKYSFIDIEKLLKLNNKKYTVKELREIAERIDIDPNNKKLELVKLIKLKIGL